ncbi:MAG: HEAT repeat domain-containing protein [Planctomycetaceae bacterium]|nr:HEAT repeat domain-containing protein [Planctomycetaceae bacterium]
MKSGLKRTFQFLKKTENEAAVEVLTEGLDSQLSAIHAESLRALLERRSPAGHQAVFNRLPKFDASDREIIAERPDRMVRVVSEALKTADKASCLNALKTILTFRLYDVMPALTAVLKTPDSPLFQPAVRIIEELTETFYQELSGQDRPGSGRDYDTLRKRLTGTLEEAVQQFTVHQSPEVLEAFLVLAKPQNAVLRRILQQPSETVHGPLVEVMSTSQRGGVLRLLLSFLDDAQMPNAARNVLTTREDVKFIENLTQYVGGKPARNVLESLTTVKSIAWARPEHPVLEQLDDACQEGLVTILVHSGMKRAEILETLGYLLLHGKPGGRRAAARAIEPFRDVRATQLVREAIDDEDPEVLAAILPQFRPRKIRDALSLMIRMVDSPHQEVLAALGRAMPEFTFRQFINNFDTMPEALLPTTGHLVRKIDLKAKQQLVTELEGLSPVRRRRAVQAAAAMGLVRTLENFIIKRLSDDDHMVRIAAAQALSECDTMPTWEALRDAMLDRSIIVQEAAEASLLRISQSLAEVPADEEGNAEESSQADTHQEVLQ